VTGTRGDTAAELSRIGREYTGWHPWMSSGGRWWATRKGSLPADPPEWWAMTVDADDAEGLRDAISWQEQHAHPVGAAAGHPGGSGLAPSAITADGLTRQRGGR
jgi:hypothetical protein